MGATASSAQIKADQIRADKVVRSLANMCPTLSEVLTFAEATRVAGQTTSALWQYATCEPICLACPTPKLPQKCRYLNMT